MKEENKYYSPEISEFYEGFEVEVNHRIRNGSGERSWGKEKFRMSEENVRFTKYLLENEPENIRVKYLDKDDIIELGFTQISNDCYTLPLSNGEELRILYENKIIVIFLADKYSNKLFQGIVRNKSELKQLLNWVNIKRN